MARSATTPKSLKLKKPIKVKMTRTEQYLINLKYMGEEPVAKAERVLTDQEYSSALSWYNYMCNRTEAREYLETYLKNTNRLVELKQLKAVPDNKFIEHAGWIARMLSRGIKLTERSLNHMNMKLKEMITNVSEVKEEKTETKKVINIQDRIKEKVSNFIGEFDEQIDKVGYTISMYDMLEKNEIQPTFANKVAEFYKPISDEAQELLKKDCNPQLKEGYNHLTKDEIKHRASFYKSILDDCDRYAGNVKKQKQARAPKPMTVEKKLKHFKFMKESKEHKLVSINPEKIIGCQEFWTFNPKYNTLTRFIALDRGGLDVDRMTITKYNGDTKTYKLSSKKVKEVLEIILSGGKRIISKTLAELKEFPIIQERINDNVILLKVT
jgi:hypothetical protein